MLVRSYLSPQLRFNEKLADITVTSGSDYSSHQQCLAVNWIVSDLGWPNSRNTRITSALYRGKGLYFRSSATITLAFRPAMIDEEESKWSMQALLIHPGFMT